MLHTRTLSLAVAAALCGLAGGIHTAPAQTPRSDPRIDSETGRDKRTWPPSVLFDHQHMKLEVTIPDMSRHEFVGRETLTVTPIGKARESITLDAGKAITMSAVRVNGAAARFTHNTEKQKLEIAFGRGFEPGQKIVLEMEYTAVKPGGGGSGLTWSRDDRRTPETDYMMHVQGEPQNNHLWYPCHDFPNERLSTELIVTVPEPYEAVSNGQLVGVKRVRMAGLPTVARAVASPNDAEPARATAASDEEPGAGRRRGAEAVDEEVRSTAEPRAGEPSVPPGDKPEFARTFHWKQDLPHANYLVTMVVSRFDIVNVGGPSSERPGLWMPVYGPLGSGEAIRQTFANTPAMIAHFEKLFGVEYPWDKYAQVLCRDFAAGAMENTGCVTFNSSLGRGRRGSQDGIIAHELVHHWFGDLVTCRSWEHLWLNEGWATMGEALWAEKVRGPDGYQAAMLRNFEQERLTSRRRALPRDNAMVSHRYGNPDQRFTAADNVYAKGGAVLHMLRERLGDETFWAGTRLYLQRHMFNQAETDDFRIAMEDVSGQSLERFFEQWCDRPGHPAIEVDYVWKPASESAGGESRAGVLSVTVEQTQTIDADNPAYAFTLPVYAVMTDEHGKEHGQYVYVMTDQKKVTTEFPLGAKPDDVEIDPYMTVLARTRVRQSLESAVRQSKHGSTLAVRLRAVQDLAERDDPRTLAPLARAALGGRGLWEPAFEDDPARVLREEASAALASGVQRQLSSTRDALARALSAYRTIARTDR